MFICYFIKKSSLDLKPSFLKRNNVNGFKNVLFFFSGDVLEVFFFKKGSAFVFEGICLGVRGKSLKLPNSSLIVRNFIHQVGIECTFSFFYNRIYSLHVQDYKRKFFVYKKSKLYFLRGKINSNTKVI